MIREVFGSILRGNRWEDENRSLHADALVIVWPVGRCGNGRLCTQLQCLEATADLVHVAANGSRVVEHKFDLTSKEKISVKFEMILEFSNR